MSIIKALSTATIQQIAAGEVIENPANIIKELVENSIDAGADNLKIILKNSGLDQILVVDNGVGMDEIDLKLASQAHTTSKLSNFADLHTLSSFGFRGEALASIAQIAQLTIKSKTAQQPYGLMLKNTAGKLTNLQPAGMPKGTSIMVSNIFDRFPARKKFLHSPATQLRLIMQIITQLALANPKVRFYVSQNGKTLLNLPSHSLMMRVRALLGQSIYSQLLPIDERQIAQLSAPSFSWSMAGYLSHPQLAKNNQLNQYLYINSRPVSQKKITQTIRNAYQNLISKTCSPAFVIFLQIPHDQLDINIHPKKSQIGIAQEAAFLESLGKVVQANLAQFDLSYRFAHQRPAKISLTERSAPSAKSVQIDQQATMKPDSAAPPSPNLYQQLKEQLDQTQPQLETAEQLILQLNKLYLLTEYQQELIIIDQHAAHERILYEQLVAQFQAKAKTITVLSPPLLLEVTAVENAALQEFAPQLDKLGIVIEEFYTHTFQIRSVPSILAQYNLVEIVKTILAQLQLNPGQFALNQVCEKLVHYLACKGAIKDNQYLNMEQRRNLIKQLFACQQPYTCPHGRPTVVKIGQHDLAKMFKRR